MKRLFKKAEKLMAAVAFAEAGEHDTAREIIREEEKTTEKRKIIRPTQRPSNRLRA